MKSSVKIIAFCLVLFISKTSYSQDVADTWNRLFTESFYLGKADKLPANVKGSPWLFNEWNYGVVVFEDGETSEPYLINLDLYKREVVIRKKDTELEYALGLNDVKEINFKDLVSGEITRSFVKLSPENFDKKIDDKSFVFEVLDKNKFLIRNTSTEYLKPETGGYSSGRDYPEFRNTEALYLLGTDGRYQYFNLKKGKLKSILGDDNAEKVLKFMDENKLNLSEISDFIQAISQVNLEN
jgi:hypothetical protein